MTKNSPQNISLLDILKAVQDIKHDINFLRKDTNHDIKFLRDDSKDIKHDIKFLHGNNKDIKHDIKFLHGDNKDIKHDIKFLREDGIDMENHLNEKLKSLSDKIQSIETQITFQHNELKNILGPRVFYLDDDVKKLKDIHPNYKHVFPSTASG